MCIRDSLKVRGPKGPLVPGSIVPATFMHLAIVAAWVGLWLRERREARLADLFRDRGSGWKVRSGRIESGSLVLLASTSGHGRSTTTFLRGQVEAPLTIRSGEDSLRVEPDKLVFGLDTTIPAKHKPREVRWETAPGAPAAVAGRFDGKSYLRASGPESLLVVSTSDEDPENALRRRLRHRLIVLAIGPVGAIIAHLIVRLG